jgi:hypothetical protein
MSLRNSGYKRKAENASAIARSNDKSLREEDGFSLEVADKILNLMHGESATVIIEAMQRLEPRASWTDRGVLRLQCSCCNLEFGNGMHEFHKCSMECA